MKNRYLTDLATSKRLWHIPAGAFSILLGAVAVDVWLEDPPGEEGFVIWLLAHLTVVSLMLLPLYRILRWRLRQRNARIIADRLARRDEASIPLAKLSRVLGVRNADKKVADLMRRGFMQRLELEDGNLLLDNPVQAPREEQSPSNDIIAQIRHLNDEIDDEAVSRRIERIEGVTASILNTLHERPDRADDARRFINYYLPMTLKLLESYRLMEKQSYQGENIQASRHRIEEVLDKLVTATEKQQDKLYRSEAMDVEAEIDVLETMMTSDGLITTDGAKQT